MKAEMRGGQGFTEQQPVPAGVVFLPVAIEASNVKAFDVSVGSRSCPAWEDGLNQATVK